MCVSDVAPSPPNKRRGPRLPKRLPKLEFYLCLGSWIAILAWVTYKLYIASQAFANNHHYQNAFVDGWQFLRHKQDNSNFEWQFWKKWFIDGWKWYLGHVVFARVVNCFSWKHRGMLYLVYGLCALLAIMGMKSTGLILAHCSILYMALLTGSKALIWATNLFLVATLNYQPFIKWHRQLEPVQDNYYMLNFTLAMLNHRFVAYCLEVCGRNKHSVFDMMVYAFYMPLVFTGPIVNYDKFEQQINAPPQPWTKPRLLYSFQRILRIIFWAFFNELLVHFLYFSALHLDPEGMRTMDLWTLAGMDIWQGMYFGLKYVVMFGLPSQLALLDQIKTVDTPRCTLTICYYTDMWKKFDRGLYQFLKRYIYIPMGGNKHGMLWSMVGSALSFVYVGYWHGGVKYLFIWVALNYVQAVLEILASFLSTKEFANRIGSKVSDAWKRRLQGVVTTPLFIASMIVIHAFFDGIDICYLYYQRFILEASLKEMAVLYLCVYCVTQTALEADIWEACREGRHMPEEKEQKEDLQTKKDN